MRALANDQRSLPRFLGQVCHVLACVPGLNSRRQFELRRSSIYCVHSTLIGIEDALGMIEITIPITTYIVYVVNCVDVQCPQCHPWQK